jgi:O-antigen/teichoic acid export membrane protein
VSVARNASWLAFGQIVMSAAGIVLAPLLARKLSLDDYGVYKQIDLAASLITPFLILGFDKSITYFVPRKGADQRAEISSAYIPILFAAVVILATALALPKPFATTFGCATLRPVVLTASVYAIAAALGVIGGRSLISVGSAKTSALLPVFIGLPRTLLLVSAAFLWPTLGTVLWTLFAFSSIEIVVWTVVLHRAGYLSWRAFSTVVLKRQVKYGGVLAFVALAQTWAAKIDRYLVSSMLPTARFAIFSNGKTRVPLLPIFSRALGDAVAPQYSKLESEKRHREMADLWRKSVDTLLPIGLLSSLCLSLTARWSIPLVYGPNFTEAVPIFQVFSFALLLDSLISVEQILRSLAALRFLLGTVLVSLAVRILIGVYILNRGGEHMLVNLVAAQLLVAFLTFLVRITYIRHRLGVSWGVLAPKRGLAVAVPLAALGWLGSKGIVASVAGPAPLILVTFAAWWGVLILVALWRQGVLERVLPGRIAAKLFHKRS